jgi:hypothetical protein
MVELSRVVAPFNLQLTFQYCCFEFGVLFLHKNLVVVRELV